MPGHIALHPQDLYSVGSLQNQLGIKVICGRIMGFSRERKVL